ncbi:21012_t:CDS:2, partial [Gigaspora rosea]
MLLPLVQSRLCPYENLINKITMQECFNHLIYFPNIYNQVFPQQATKKKYGINIVFANEDYQEELYFPCIHYTLNQTEIKKLKQHYKTINSMTVARKIFEDNLGLQFFKNISNTEFIDISVIDRCVGFLPIGSITYIIDKNVDSLNK